MAICPICGKEFPAENMCVQFIDDESTEHYACAECDKAISSIIEEDDDCESNLKYVESRLDNCTDDELKCWLLDKITSVKDQKKERETLEAESDPKNTTGWISALKIVYKCEFFLIILCTMFADDNIGLGLILLFLSILIAVTLVGFQMVFLDMAKDLHYMKNMLEEIKNK